MPRRSTPLLVVEALVLDRDDRVLHHGRDLLVASRERLSLPVSDRRAGGRGRRAATSCSAFWYCWRFSSCGQVGGDRHHHPEHASRRARARPGRQKMTAAAASDAHALRRRRRRGGRGAGRCIAERAASVAVASPLRRRSMRAGSAVVASAAAAGRWARRPRRRGASRERRTQALAWRRTSSMPPTASEAAFLARNAVDALPAGGLAAAWRPRREGRPLRVKLGLDPTAPDIHLGHTVVLQKLREFQDLGHTRRADHRRLHRARGRSERPLGDAPGALAARRSTPTPATYQEQALQGAARRPERLEVRLNGEWLDMAMEDLFRLVRTTTVAQLLERDDFAKRWAAQAADLGARAALPAAAGLRLGRRAGRRRARRHRPDVQPAARARHPARLRPARAGGADDADPAGHRRRARRCRSRSATTSASPSRRARCTARRCRIPDDALDAVVRAAAAVEPPPAGAAPRDAKRALARALVERFHGAEAADAAEADFDRVHVQRAAARGDRRGAVAAATARSTCPR